MILLGLVSMGIFLGMPYLVENSEPIPPPPRRFIPISREIGLGTRLQILMRWSRPY